MATRTPSCWQWEGAGHRVQQHVHGPRVIGSGQTDGRHAQIIILAFQTAAAAAAAASQGHVCVCVGGKARTRSDTSLPSKLPSRPRQYYSPSSAAEAQSCSAATKPRGSHMGFCIPPPQPRPGEQCRACAEGKADKRTSRRTWRGRVPHPEAHCPQEGGGYFYCTQRALERRPASQGACAKEPPAVWQQGTFGNISLLISNYLNYGQYVTASLSVRHCN